MGAYYSREYLRMSPEEQDAERAARHVALTRDLITRRDPAALADAAAFIVDSEVFDAAFTAAVIRAALYPTDDDREALRALIEPMVDRYVNWLCDRHPDRYGDLLLDGPDRVEEC